MIIFKKNSTNDKINVRMFGHDFVIDNNEATQYIKSGQAFFKANKPVLSLKQVLV